MAEPLEATLTPLRNIQGRSVKSAAEPQAMLAFSGRANSGEHCTFGAPPTAWLRAAHAAAG